MRFSSLLSSTLLVAGSTSQVAAAVFRGFSMGSATNTGAAKTTADWTADFTKIKSWPGGFNAVRLYSSSDQGTLAQAVPAALNTGMKILVGIWAEDDTHFGVEKAALLSAIKSFGTNWIAGISVGSEDLYRATKSHETTPQKLAGQIYDVRGMVRQFNKNIQVGHTDTWTAWVDPANDVVTKACDFVITDGYPYWQGVALVGNGANVKQTFYDSVNAVKARVAVAHAGIPVWIGETGWPTGGDAFGGATTGITNLRKYWAQVGCQLIKDNTNFFWYSAFDSPTATGDHEDHGVEKHFGVAYPGRTLKFKLTC